MAGPLQETQGAQPPQDVSPVSTRQEEEVTIVQEKGDGLDDAGDGHSTLTGSDTTQSGDGEQNPGTLSHTISITPPPVKVPRSKRRGLFAGWTLVAEVEVPRHYPRNTKWFITFVISIAGAAAPMGSAIFFPALSQVSESLHATDTITNLSVALYMLSMSIFPLWWSSFSERLGRRTIYLVSFTMFTLFAILSAVARSIDMLIVMRMLSGGAAASVQAVGAGTIADIWEVKERGRAMGIFYLGPLCGPLFAPIVGGALANRWSWRSTQWFLAIYGGVMVAFLLFGLPETLERRKSLPALPEESEPPPPRVERTLSRVSSRQVVAQTSRALRVLKLTVVDPLKILLYLRFPAVFLTVAYASITFGSLYVLNVSIQDAFGKAPYNFSILILGLLYIPNSLGYILSSIVGGRWMDAIMQREAKKANRVDERGRLIFIPEDRMKENAWFGALVYPAALIWYGWTVQKGVHWIVPMIANFFFGLGSMIIFSVATTMLTEFMPKRSSSGVAVNNFMRNIFSCVGGVVAAPVIHAIGNGWMFTILGLTALAGSSVIWAMGHFGPRWRESMDRRMK
ncbi:hypothetical protein VTO42DRAFT_461 [Malbranchea cinnamomea]